MIRVTLDANVLASGALAVTGPIAALIEAWRRDHVTVVLSAHILAEMERALGKPYFAQRLDPRARSMYQRLARRRATVIPITTPIPSIVSSYCCVTLDSIGRGHCSLRPSGGVRQPVPSQQRHDTALP